MPIFYQHIHTTLKYCWNVIYESCLKLGSLRWEKGTLLIDYRINKSSKPLWKIDKLTFTKIYWLVLEATLKSKQPFTLSYILSLSHCSHVTYLTHQDTPYESSELVCHHLSLYIFRVNFLLKRQLFRVHKISCHAQHLERTDSKPFSRLIGPTHINK